MIATFQLPLLWKLPSAELIHFCVPFLSRHSLGLMITQGHNGLDLVPRCKMTESSQQLQSSVRAAEVVVTHYNSLLSLLNPVSPSEHVLILREFSGNLILTDLYLRVYFPTTFNMAQCKNRKVVKKEGHHS